MVTKTLKVDVFDVEEAGEEFPIAIRRATRADDGARLREANRKVRRLEHYRNTKNYTLLNFATFNYPGPGRVAADSPVAPIGLAGGEHFSQETAMLFDNEAGLVFLEAGRGGMGPGAVASYFEGFIREGAYALVPRLDPEAAAKARRMHQFRKIRMRVSVGLFAPEDRQHGVGMLETFAESLEGKFIDVVVSVGPERKRTMIPQAIQNLVNEALGAHDEGRVSKLLLQGRDHEDESPEWIDLIQHRERRTRELLVDPARRWVVHEARWDALVQIREDYLRDVAAA